MASDSGSLPVPDSQRGNDPERSDPGLLPKAGRPLPDADLDVSAITGPASAPPDIPDHLTQLARAHPNLKPAERVALQHLQIVEHYERHILLLTADKSGFKQECEKSQVLIDGLREALHASKVELIELKTTRRGDQWKDASVIVAAAIGASLISSFKYGEFWFSFGWALVVLSTFYGLMRALLNTP